jgi:hypothetical protein
MRQAAFWTPRPATRPAAAGCGRRGLLVAMALGVALALACADEREAPAPAPVPDAEIAGLYEALTDGDTAAEEQAIARIEAAQDRRFVPVLLELMRAGQMGIAGRAGYNQRMIALERLTGEALGGDWFSWAEWYEGSDFAPPPGFASWKGQLWTRIDPGFGELLEDEHPARIRVEEVDWGGIRMEGVPALDDPAHVAADAAPWLGGEEPVVGVAIGGEARAYPLRILDWHELVNDRLGGVPFALAYCTLSGSAIAYDTRREGAAPYRFSTSGLLHRSNKLMLDRDTRTLWNQLTGRAVLGPLAAEERALALLPAVVTSWQAWRERHPDTSVLSLDTGHERPYLPGTPYGSYFASPQKMFPARERRKELPTKERVYGLWHDGVAKAWPLAELLAARVTNDALGGEAVVLVAGEGRVEVGARSAEADFSRYEAGGAVRAYRRGAVELARGPDDRTLRDAAGGVWRLEEDALVGPAGERLPRLPGTLAYWFAWQAFHPDTALLPVERRPAAREPLVF